MNEFNLDYIINPIEQQTLNDLWDLYSTSSTIQSSIRATKPQCPRLSIIVGESLHYTEQDQSATVGLCNDDGIFRDE